MSITKVYIPDYELSYLEAKPESTAAAYSHQEVIWEDPKCFHEFLDLTAIWHDASEEPNENTDILFISKNGNVHKVSKVDNSLYSWLTNNKDIKRWAYINDLLPKGGEG